MKENYSDSVMEVDARNLTNSNAPNRTGVSEDFQSLSLHEKRVSHLIFKWTIKHYSTVTLAYTQSIISPPFPSEVVPTTWFLKHTPVVIADENKRVSFYLCRSTSDEGPQVIIATYRIGVKIFYEQIWFPEKRGVLFRAGDESKVDISIRDYFRRDTDLNQDKLVIFCEMYITPSQAESLAPKGSNIWRIDQVNLSLDLLNCASAAKFSDVVLQVKNLKFFAHKAILSVRSPRFADICLNLRDSILLLLDDYDHINCLLTYIYSGNPYFALENRDLCIGLFECAKKYCVSGLQQLLSPVKIAARTLPIDENNEFIWKIERLSSIAENMCNVVSPPFCDNSKIIPKCILKIYFKGASHTTDSMEIYIKASEQLNALYLKISIAILDRNMQEIFKKEIESSDVLFDEHGFSDYITNNELFGNPEFIHNDQLIIKSLIELSISRGTLDEIKTPPFPTYDEHFQCLSKECESLLLDETFSDITVVIDEEIFRLHKAILAIRCPVLESRLQQEDCEDCVIGITDLSPEIFSSMISYMYTGIFSNRTPNFTIKLYEAAELYKMKLLTNSCSRYLRSHLDSTSICDVIILAHKHEDEELMTNCLNYVSCNKSEIFSSVEWKAIIDSQSDLSIQLQQWTANLRLLTSN